MHRLVQDVTRRSLDAPTFRRRLTEALDWANAAFCLDPRDVRSWPILQPLASHEKNVTQSADMEGIAKPTALLINKLGVLLHTMARYAKAEPLLRRALEIAQANYGPNHLILAGHLSNLAGLLEATNCLAEAEQLYRRALATPGPGAKQSRHDRDSPRQPCRSA